MKSRWIPMLHTNFEADYFICLIFHKASSYLECCFVLGGGYFVVGLGFAVVFDTIHLFWTLWCETHFKKTQEIQLMTWIFFLKVMKPSLESQSCSSSSQTLGMPRQGPKHPNDVLLFLDLGVEVMPSKNQLTIKQIFLCYRLDSNVPFNYPWKRFLLPPKWQRWKWDCERLQKRTGVQSEITTGLVCLHPFWQGSFEEAEDRFLRLL